jgi:hypothetical protein
MRLALRNSGGWIAALVGALIFVAVDSAARIEHLTTMEGMYGVQVTAPDRDPSSPTGYDLGRRSFVEPGNSADTYHWVMQTQTMLAGGPWRIHRVDYDNAPDGREMHWSSLPRWWLALLAWIGSRFSGSSVNGAVEQATFYANPLLLAFFLIGLIPVIARRFGGAAAALLAIGSVASYPFYLNFIAGNAEHQGAAEACALLTVLCLLGGAGGWVGSSRAESSRLGTPTDDGSIALPTPVQARRWFLASAVAGGLGLWLSAASEAPVLAGAGLGAIACLAIGRRGRGPKGGCLRPELWRLWGIAGCTVSFAAYAIEYFPSGMGWRLEVNHPLYGLAWLGGGELLCQLGLYWAPEKRAVLGRSGLVHLAAGAILIGLLPLVALLTRDRTFWVADPFLWRLHTLYIAEFHSMRWQLAQSGWNFAAAGRLLPLLLSVPPLAYFGLRSTPSFWRSQLILALVPAGVELALAAQQLRWWGLASGVAFVAVLPLFAFLEQKGERRRFRHLWQLACFLLLIPGALNAVRLISAETRFSTENIHGLADRDLAQWLRLRAGRDPVVVLSTPNTTTSLIYHGSLRGLGTLYWENRDGLEAAAAIFAAPTLEQAHTLIQSHHITHIVFTSWDPFATAYVQLARGSQPGAALAPGTFTDALLGASSPPTWLRPIPYPLPQTAALQNEHVLIFEVTDPQQPREILVHNAEYLMETGHPDTAARLLPALRSLNDYLPALAEAARIQGQSGDAAGVEVTMDRIAAIGTIPRNLASEDQVLLAVALAIGGRIDPARQVMENCLQQMDERTLRRLTAGTLSDLLSLCDHLGISFPDPSLRALALKLLPPRLR